MKAAFGWGLALIFIMTIWNLSAQAVDTITTTVGNGSEPQLYPVGYGTAIIHQNIDVIIRSSQPGTNTGGQLFVKKISPAPATYPFIEFNEVGKTSYFYYWDTLFQAMHEILVDSVAGYFWQPGRYELRGVYYWNCPFFGDLNTQEFWNWTDTSSTCIKGSDFLTFGSTYPNALVSICQACPRNWLPVIDGYIDGTGHVNHTDFKVLLKAYFSPFDSTQSQSYKLRWVLHDISWYSGQAMNYQGSAEGQPTVADSTDNGGPGYVDPPRWHYSDLMILDRYNDTTKWSCAFDTTDHAFWATSKQSYAAGDTAAIVVSCYDFGAHGNIHVEVQADSTSPFFNMTYYMEADSQVKNYSTIPIDEDGFGEKDRMADYWEETMLADSLCPDTSILQISPEQDEDGYIRGVLPCASGDYLNVFEEYRGFNCRGVHTRTSPWKKEFFIYSDLDSMNFNTGIGYANLIGPGLCHLIDTLEMYSYARPDPRNYIQSARRSINYLSDRIDNHQNCACAILLENLSWDSTAPSIRTLGETWIKSTTPIYAIPDTVIVGYVYTPRIKYRSPDHRDTIFVDLPQDSLAQHQVAGQEIGHMVNMGENPQDSSSIMAPLYDWDNIPSEYHQVDIDSFLVKPRIQ